MDLRFPLFIDLKGRRVVVVGGGAVGLRRAQVLQQFGAAVTVISPALGGPGEDLDHKARAYCPGDLEGAFLAVAAADNPAVNDAVQEEANRLGIPFNRADRREACDFFFPAICRTENLIAGLVGDGSDHKKTARAAAAVRKTLEELE